jgi:alpha-mannosidase
MDYVIVVTFLIYIVVCSRSMSAQIGPGDGWLSAPDRALVSQLASYSELPKGVWKIHEGDLAHGEDPELDDSSWQTARTATDSPTSAVWYREWLEVPKTQNGYDLTGSSIYLNFAVQAVRGAQAEDQGYLGVTKIVYLNGRRIAMGEDLEPVLVFDQAKPGERVLIAVKVLTDPASRISIHPSFRVGFVASRPSPQDVHDEIASAAILIPILASDVEVSKGNLESAIHSIDAEALRTGDQQRFDDSLRKTKRELEPLKPILGRATIVLTGQSHIDAAYRWPWTETVDIVRRTFGTALQLMNEYPAYTFTQSTAQYSEWMADKYPAMNDDIKRRIKEGRWELAGGMWVEPDFNIPDGESQVRQLLIGNHWFENNYGVDVRVGWNPDSFGFDWQLPQIYKKSGVDFFVTTKLGWNDTNKLPFHLFWWQSPDGSRVLTYFPPTFASSDLSPVRLSEGLAQLRRQAPGLNEIMDVYGVGDHGGGATRVVLDQGVRWMQPDKVAPAMRFGTALSFFTDLQGKISDRSPVWNYRTVATGNTQLTAPPPGEISIPTWNDELYLETHRGTYTTQAAQKAHIRRSEESMLNAEKYASLAWLDGRPYPSDELKEAWKRVAFNGFHDLAAGSGAGMIYRDAAKDFEHVRWATNEITSSAIATIASEIDTRVASGVPVLVFNPLAWDRGGLVEVNVQLPAAASDIAVLDGHGNSLPFVIQSKDKTTHSYRLLVEAKPVPSLGYRVLRVVPHARAFPSDLKVHGFTLENSFLRVTVDEKTGCMISLYDKEANFETLAAGSCGNQLLAYTDIPQIWDAWNIDADYIDHPIDLGPAQSVRLVESGPMRAVIRVTRAALYSTFSQDVTLYSGADYVDVVNDIDWHETHVLLKVAFPVAASSNFATYEIPYGTIERPTTRNNSWEDAKFEVPAIRWADLGNGSQGLSLINESKYGYDAKDNVLRLTLLRAPMAPDPTADRGKNHFSYALYPHAGDWKQALTIRHGYEYNYKLSAMQVGPHPGTLPQEHSFLRVDPDTVVLTAVKKAEGGNGLILRFYEWAGKGATVHINVPPGASSAGTTNLMEKAEGDSLPVTGSRQITTSIHPYEIQTIEVNYLPHAGLQP